MRGKRSDRGARRADRLRCAERGQATVRGGQKACSARRESVQVVEFLREKGCESHDEGRRRRIATRLAGEANRRLCYKESGPFIFFQNKNLMSA